MQFRIACETFYRMANAAKPYDTVPKRPHLECVRIERRDNVSYVIATNSLVLAVEMLGTDVGPDGEVNIVIAPEILQQCFTERDEGELIIEPMAGVQWTVCKTASGWVYHGNAAIYHPYENWRALIPYTLSEESHGFIYTNAEVLADLGRSSPSGRFVFPKVIDTRQPMIVRDSIDSAWFGLFVAVSSDRSRNFIPAAIPDWLK